MASEERTIQLARRRALYILGSMFLLGWATLGLGTTLMLSVLCFVGSWLWGKAHD